MLGPIAKSSAGTSLRDVGLAVGLFRTAVGLIEGLDEGWWGETDGEGLPLPLEAGRRARVADCLVGRDGSGCVA
ncbi:hypothetical protein GCM10009733_006170 [Nonomuraea maheshkhaliensis]|uniref:Uncharacterized protein n=1 Tax=Nonomuraea maheshkhaliensis TaxID=419590 RepID=A0ABP4QKH3_9ACTN